MRFGAFFWDWLARRVFSSVPHATVVFLFFAHFSSPDTHTLTHGHGKRQSEGGKKSATGRGAGKKRARSLLDRARPLG